MGPDPAALRGIADQVREVMRANPNTRQVNRTGASARRRHISCSIRTACG